MARRFKKKRAFRGFATKKRYGRSKSGGSNPLMVALCGAGYGAAENYIKPMAAPVYNMLPFGKYNDSIVFGGIGYFAAKKGKGLLKSAGQAILTIESYNASKDFTGGSGFNATTTSTTSAWQ